MSLMTDKQTLDDLNIFGKRGGDSIYSIFNRTSTRGGALLLEEMFRDPLSRMDAINQRSGVIRFFSVNQFRFPYDVEWFDAVEQYLQNTDERSKLSETDNTIGRKFNNLIAADTGFKQIRKGVASLIQILQATARLVADLGEKAAGSGYEEELSILKKILAREELQAALQENQVQKMSFQKVADHDKQLRFRQRDLMQKLLTHIYAMDVFLSVAKVAMERNYAFPMARKKEDQVVVLKDFYHPALQKPVTNSLTISPDSNIIFLTGANMAGKSTFMKSMGVAMFLAHMGFPVPASAMEFSVRDGIFTTINLPDNLAMGASHFYAEVLRIKSVAAELSRDKYLFVIFDELFRGTNVKDAYEATVAITSAIARRKNCMFVVSTHIIEAGDKLKGICENINFVYLPTLMDGSKPVYTHKLTQGITSDRHGMVIIRNEGILDILTKKKGREGIAI
ncbi:MAG: DNA mismatch repair protein [Chitinophagaceae bacterium]|nr:DNA mismatch repair protein [Chitinophagaceae bacterium]